MVSTFIELRAKATSPIPDLACFLIFEKAPMAKLPHFTVVSLSFLHGFPLGASRTQRRGTVLAKWMKNARTFASMLANVRRSQATCQQALKKHMLNARRQSDFAAAFIACLPYCRPA